MNIKPTSQPKKSQISAIVDGHPIQRDPGTTLLQAIRSLGLNVPTLCHSPRLIPSGGCRLCLVKIEGEGLVAACSTKLESGKSYISQSESLTTYRRFILKMIFNSHPLHCQGCSVDKRCRLQRVAEEMGFSSQKKYSNSASISNSNSKKNSNHPFINLEPDLCIQCNLCVQACDTIQGTSILGMLGRGHHLKLSTAADVSLEEAGCLSCGQCLFECPTGALTERCKVPYLPNTIKKITTTCGYCAVGCRLTATIQNNTILFMEPDPKGSANRGHACVKGRFGFGFVNHSERLKTPLIRQADGTFKISSWTEALTLIGKRFAEIRDRYGANGFGTISSARLTNEENFGLQKFTRLVMKTNNIDNCARVCHSPSAFALGESLGTGAGTNSFEDIEHSDVLVLVGANPTESHPVLGSRIQQAVKNGCKLIVLDPRNTTLARLATIHLPLKPGSNVAVINAMQSVLIEENLINHTFIQNHSEGFDTLKKILKHNTPQWAAPISNLTAESIRLAARLYASGPSSQILWGLGVTESCQGTLSAFGLINMAIMTGNLGRLGTGSSPIRGQNNVQGACDMGALPNVLSDYQPLNDPKVIQRHEQVWGLKPPSQPGMKMPEMLSAALEGTLKGLYLIAQDPAQSDPNTKKVKEALEKLEFLVVQDIFPSESSRFAHVILPAACFLEKSGTFVNSDRRIQPVSKSVDPPGEAQTDGEILNQLAHHMGFDLGFDLGFDSGAQTPFDPDKVLTEIALLTPNWAGVSSSRLKSRGFLQWPCPHPEHPGTSIVHKNGHFLRGKARLTPTPWQPPKQTTDSHFPFLLTTGRTLFHYNVGSMTRRTPITKLKKASEERVYIHWKDAKKLDIQSGERVFVISAQGQVMAKAWVGFKTNPGLVFMSFHFPQSQTNLLIGDHADHMTQCPEYKVTAVRVEKLPG